MGLQLSCRLYYYFSVSGMSVFSGSHLKAKIPNEKNKTGLPSVQYIVPVYIQYIVAWAEEAQALPYRIVICDLVHALHALPFLMNCDLRSFPIFVVPLPRCCCFAAGTVVWLTAQWMSLAAWSSTALSSSRRPRRPT